MAKFCGTCGNPLQETSTFCGACGARVVASKHPDRAITGLCIPSCLSAATGTDGI